MKILDLIKEDYIWIDQVFENEEDIFRTVSEKAKCEGKVKESFYQALVERENNFPTGLNLGNYAVAIPHTDSEHVLSEFVAIIRPQNKVVFQGMEDPDEKIEIDIIFLMALNESDNHLTILREIMTLIQDESLMEILSEAKDKKEIINILERVELDE